MLRLPLLSWVLIALGSSGAVGVAAEPPPGPPREGLDAAVRELIESSADEVRRDPGNGEALARLCMAYEANLLWPEAARCYSRLAELEPGRGVWRLHEAMARIECGEVERAREALQVALELDPALAAARQRLAYLLLESGELEAAQRLFEVLVENLPERAEGYLGTGEVDLLAGRLERATARLERAVALDPRSSAAHYQLGLAYRAAGRLQEAERELALGTGGRRPYLASPLDARVAELAVHRTARVERAGALLAAGRDAEATGVLEDLVQQSPRSPTLWNDLAVAYLRQGRLDEARDALDRAAELEPEGFSTWLNLSSWASRAGDAGAAVIYARQAVALAPGVSATHLALARTLGDPRHAETVDDREAVRRQMLAELEWALEIGVDTPDAHMLLGREKWRDGDIEGALEALDPALARWPDFWPGHLMRAWILVRAGRFTEGEQSLEVVRATVPEHPDVVEIERLLAARED